jgi:DNA-binding CsgD family transcriptional regulator
VTRRLIERFAEVGEAPAPPALDELTARELEVLRMPVNRTGPLERGDRRRARRQRAQTHVAKVLGKLALRDWVQAVVLAYECGLVRPGSG